MFTFRLTSSGSPSTAASELDHLIGLATSRANVPPPDKKKLTLDATNDSNVLHIVWTRIDSDSAIEFCLTLEAVSIANKFIVG
jgi:hypothetical protein